MTGIWFPALPTDWDTRNVAVADATGCWIWTDERPRPLTWRQARTLIATEKGVTDATDCALTPSCVHPYHSRRSRIPAGGSA